MINKFSTLMKVFIVSIAAIIAIPSMPTYALTNKNQAPNMYVNWPDNGDYDLMMVDWYCEKDAVNTYWAVHNWAKGYAGFQNKDGEHKLIMSIWDGDDGKKPVIEYVTKNGKANNFGGEGTGKNIFTNYNWQIGKWYTMCVGTRTINGKTQYAQWIRKGNGAWLLTAIISYPEADRKFNSDSMFQEDFTFNNLSRKCRLRNAYGRRYGTNKWESWSSCQISNSYFPYVETTWNDVKWNVSFNCNWGKSSNSRYLMVQSGGNTNSDGNQLSLKLKQRFKPAAGYPKWPAVTTQYKKRQ